MTWESNGDEIVFSTTDTRVYEYEIEGSVLRIRRPGAPSHSYSQLARRSGDDDIFGQWQRFTIQHGTTRSMQRDNYLEFFADGTGREMHPSGFTSRIWWEYFTYERGDGLIVLTFSPSTDAYIFEIEGNTMTLTWPGAGARTDSFTRGATTPENERTHPESPPTITASQAPVAQTPEATTPNEQPFEDIAEPPMETGSTGGYLPMGRWEMTGWFNDFGPPHAQVEAAREHGMEVRFYENGRGFFRGGGVFRDVIFRVQEYDEVLVMYWFDGSFGYNSYQFTYNPYASTLFVNITYAETVSFEQSFIQSTPSADLDRVLFGRWQNIWDDEPFELEFFTNNTGRWADSFETFEFEWLFDEDILLIWNSEHVGEPFYLIVFSPFSGGSTQLLMDTRSQSRTYTRTSDTQDGIIGVWSNSEAGTAIAFNENGTGMNMGFDGAVSFDWSMSDDVLIMGSETERMLYRFSLDGNNLCLYSLSYLMIRD
jgi:hypothetical protein